MSQVKTTDQETAMNAQVTNPRPPTENELAFLRGLAEPGAGSRDGQWRPSHMIARLPGFAGRHPAGLHQTAHSLMSKGLVRRRKFQEHVAYQLTAAGRAQL
jgi:hypothetical protein